MPRLNVNCGAKDLMFPSPVDAVYACRTESVLAITTDSGPAAASKPFFEAILSNEAVEGGRLSDGHGEGKSFSFELPAMV